MRCASGDWAVSEPRSGDRLRLNAFCGLNLASHGFSLNDRPFSWLYRDPDLASTEEIAALFTEQDHPPRLSGEMIPANAEAGKVVLDQLKGSRIARIGERPEGFYTCDYSPSAVRSLVDIDVDEVELDQLL